MSQWTASRKFRNAKGTVCISVCGKVESHPFKPAGVDAIITDILATGGLVPRNDEERDEAARLSAYIAKRYVGKTQKHFMDAREIVMGHNIAMLVGRLTFPDLRKQPDITIVNTIEMPGVATPEAARRVAEAIRNSVASSVRRPLYENKCRARFDNVENFKGVENVPDKRFFDAPTLGTYWRQKSRNKDYQVIGVSEHENYVTVRMQRTTNDGVFDFPFHSKELWLHEFEQCFRIHDEFYTDPYAAMAASFKDVPYSAQRVALEALRPQRRWFVIDPRQVGKTEAHAIAGAFRAEYPELAEMWKGKEHELPPAEGERYQSLIMGRNIYRVLDARRKLNSEDWYITMIRECDGHKAKFTYRDHATWFLVWVPVIDEEVQQQPSRAYRPGVNLHTVELKVDMSDVTEGLKKVGEAAHEAAQATWQFREADAERQLRIIMAELDKRLPNWNDAPAGPVMYDDCALIIRAIRTLARAPKEAEAQLADSRLHAGQQLEQINRLNKKLAKTRVVPAVGSVWRTNSTGTYATVTHVFAESGMAKMRSAKGAEYDLPLDRLFEYSTLATGPATLLGAIGEVQCNAYGMTQEETKLKDVMAGSVFHIRELQHSSTGDVTVSGFLHAKKPAKEG